MNREDILSNDLSWTTINEINAIDFIARDKRETKHESEDGKITVTTSKITKSERKKKLKGYIQSCYNRVNWGQINKIVCELYAQEKLAKL